MFLSVFPNFSLPAGLMPASSSSPSCCFVRAAVVCSSSARRFFCSSFFVIAFLFFRPYAGIFFLVFVLFRPCSSYLFLISTHVVLLATFLILHHILQNYCRLFFCLFSSYFSCFSVWLVLFCSRTRYASISLALP